eukprot:s91_g26.t1
MTIKAMGPSIAALGSRATCSDPLRRLALRFAVMLGRVSRAIRPRLARHVSQVLAEPMAWNQALVVVTTLANGVKVATKETFAENLSWPSHTVLEAVMVRTLVLPISHSPGTSSSLRKTLDILKALAGRATAALPPALFLVMLRYCYVLLRFSTYVMPRYGYVPAHVDLNSELAASVCDLLSQIPRPIIGVAKGRISCQGAQLLSSCDRVLACDDAHFLEGQSERLGAVQTVPAWVLIKGAWLRCLSGNWGCEMAVLAHCLERLSSAELASMKTNFLCSKVLQMMKPKVSDTSVRSAKDELARAEALVPDAKGPRGVPE